MKSRANLIYLVERMNNARRCSATSKRSRCRCRAPAVTGWRVCRFHGARSGAPKGKANGAWLNGMSTNDMVAERKERAELVREARVGIAKINK